MPYSIKEIIKYILIFINFIIGFISFRKPCKIIIYYHGVLDSEKKKFERQIEYLAKKCQIVPLSQIDSTKHINRKNIIAITFDDAFQNILTNAIPLLQKNNIGATIFVPTGNFGEYPKWYIPKYTPDINQKIMTEEELRQLDQSGFDIGSHTVSHKKLTELNDQELHAEIHDSKAKLEQLLQHTIETISYPNGCYNQSVLDKVKECGYVNAYSINSCCLREKTKHFEVPRFKVTPNMPLWKFKLVATGSSNIIGSLKLK